MHRLRQHHSPQSRFDDPDDLQEEYIQTGKLLHSLFATIRTEADIDAAVDKMLSDGLIESRSKAESLKNQIFIPEARTALVLSLLVGTLIALVCSLLRMRSLRRHIWRY